MKSTFRVKTKLSWSPGKTVQGIFTVRGMQGSKITPNSPRQQKQNMNQKRRSLSKSAHKLKTGSPNMFKKAHIIEPTETYLIKDRKSPESLTKGSTSPTSSKSPVSKIPGHMVSPGKFHSRTNSGTLLVSQNNQAKVIQRTVAIAYKGITQNVPVAAELMTTLSKIILGDEKCQDDFFLEVLAESSIHGDEENYIDFGENDILADMEALERADGNVKCVQR